jgi:hypothetical protein
VPFFVSLHPSLLSLSTPGRFHSGPPNKQGKKGRLCANIISSPKASAFSLFSFTFEAKGEEADQSEARSQAHSKAYSTCNISSTPSRCLLLQRNNLWMYSSLFGLLAIASCPTAHPIANLFALFLQFFMGYVCLCANVLAFPSSTCHWPNRKISISRPTAHSSHSPPERIQSHILAIKRPRQRPILILILIPSA